MECLLLHKGKQVVDPAAWLSPVVAAVGIANPTVSPAAGRKSAGSRLVIQ